DDGGSGEGHRGEHVGLLADLVLSAGGRRGGCAVGQRPGCEERARAGGDRQAGCGGVGQGGREGAAAAGGWPPRADAGAGVRRPSFVPPTPIRVLRDYTRMRVDLVRDRTRYWLRLEKLLEDALIKVSSVASSLKTVSTRDMVEALIAGQRDPQALAQLARGA